MRTDAQRFPASNFTCSFDSLSRVLFNFPSQYLFAIGLSLIFSLGWRIPPYLGCTPKQPDSLKTALMATYVCKLRTGLSPSMVPLSRGLEFVLSPSMPRQTTRQDIPEGTLDFQPELFPLHSPLLRESLLVSFPPLTDMLKLSG